MTVGVVGAGISGLALTHFLERRGVDVVTFEAADEPGGIIKSRTVEGRVLELGPQRLRLTEPIRRLVDAFDLQDELSEGNTDQPLYVYHDGRFRVAPLSIREALTTDLLSWRSKLRILAEPLTGGQREGESVEAFLTRKFGREAAHRYLAPLYTGLYGSDPDEMLMEYSLGKALDRHGVEGSILLSVAKLALKGRDPPPIVTFEDGMQRLPEAMAERYRDAVHLSTPVEAVAADGDGYTLHADGDAVSVDAVALTPPAPTAADLVEPTDATMAETLRRFTYNPLAIVHLHSRYGREGHGCQILPETGCHTLGMTWNDSMLDRDGVYTSYLGTRRDGDLLERSDETIGDIAAEEFEELTGASAEVLNVHRWEPGMPAYDRSWRALEDLDPPEGVFLCTNYTERAGIIGRVGDARSTAESIAGYLGVE
ncbi:MAG: protoporphyrinogen oxidase [Halodesulfurarchaeum sp.]